MVWETNGTPDTLVGTSDQMIISDVTPKLFNQYLFQVDPAAGTINMNMRLNGDVGNNYARNQQTNGGTNSAVGGLPSFALSPSTAQEYHFGVVFIYSLNSDEKLGIAFVSETGGSGSNTIPDRKMWSGKWDNAINSINSVQGDNEGTGNYDVGSNLSALGTN